MASISKDAATTAALDRSIGRVGGGFLRGGKPGEITSADRRTEPRTTIKRGASWLTIGVSLQSKNASVWRLPRV
jgi:hypothetical protein